LRTNEEIVEKVEEKKDTKELKIILDRFLKKY